MNPQGIFAIKQLRKAMQCVEHRQSAPRKKKGGKIFFFFGVLAPVRSNPPPLLLRYLRKILSGWVGASFSLWRRGGRNSESVKGGKGGSVRVCLSACRSRATSVRHSPLPAGRTPKELLQPVEITVAVSGVSKLGSSSPRAGQGRTRD